MILVDIKQITSDKYEVRYIYSESKLSDFIVIGEILQNDDGFWVFWPTGAGGYWEEIVLRVICDKMKELNDVWQKHIDAFYDPKTYHP